MADADFWARHLQADFQQQVQEGWGNDESLEDARLAAEVQQMDMNAYARFRKQNKIGSPDLVEFLGGTNQTERAIS